MKQCTGHCGRVKPLSEFYKNLAAKDGHTTRCKECLKEQSKKDYHNNPIGGSARVRAYQQMNREKIARQRRTPGNIKKKRDASDLWSMLNPEKVKAHKKVGYALKTGKLIRPSTCSSCRGGGRIEAHHEDYEKPLEVIWLCSSCHRIEHL
ncbi:hypothetical protein KAR91_83800 [Candidatus Pacearchaeota archaeon]|nr:hypothetical protein [Candidatus Pacearchaeota archaeon]